MKRVGLGLAALVALVLMPTSPALGATESTAWCYGTWHVNFSPGVDTTPRTSTFTTRAATVNCVGTVRGHDVLGIAALQQDGVLHGTLLTGTGSGTKTLVIPTRGGPQTVSIPFTMSYTAGIGLQNSDSLVGPLTFVFYPTQGDGVTTPVTQIGVVGEGVLRT